MQCISFLIDAANILTMNMSWHTETQDWTELLTVVLVVVLVLLGSLDVTVAFFKSLPKAPSTFTAFLLVAAVLILLLLDDVDDFFNFSESLLPFILFLALEDLDMSCLSLFDDEISAGCNKINILTIHDNILNTKIIVRRFGGSKLSSAIITEKSPSIICRYKVATDTLPY